MPDAATTTGAAAIGSVIGGAVGACCLVAGAPVILPFVATTAAFTGLFYGVAAAAERSNDRR